jgi:hypothetical protein
MDFFTNDALWLLLLHTLQDQLLHTGLMFKITTFVDAADKTIRHAD